MAGYDAQLRAEQEVVDTLYARLDALRAHTRSRLDGVRRAGPSGSPQNRSERDAFATLYENRLAQLEGVEERLVFGRLDLIDGELRYVGRIGLTDDDHDSLLTDWRAPAARAFYRATAAAPDGVLRRRHVVTTARTVTGVEDELLDIGAVRQNAESSDSGRIVAEGLTGEGALLAALAAGRTGRMSDIVATIQAEQDVIIRDDLAGALVVQGGPGTGKTAVALHRAAYLLYAHRERLERSGVLMVGPSRAFLRYIDQVLPSLGETGVVSLTIAELIPGVRAAGTEDDAVAEIKGRAVMATVVERAVAARHRVPNETTTVRIDGRTVRITPSDIAASISRAERMHRPHNEGRVTFVRDMLNKLATQYVRQLGFAVSPEDRADVVEELRSAREVRVALNLAWMPLTPQRLLADLWAKPYRLAEAAPMLTAAERDLLARPAGSPWTPADVPLLDEAAELLGDDDQAMQAQARADAAARSEQVNYAREVLAISGNALVSAELLADRFESVGPSGTTADRAAADRTWAYGHIVVDEAQELSPMAWRSLLRRVPTRSLTIVGDVAQTSAAAGTSNWAERLDPVLRGSWRQSDLTVSYRTPAVVAETAMAVARAAGLPVSDLVAARDISDSLVVVTVEAEQLAAAVVEQVATASALAGADGSVAVIGEGLDVLGLTAAGLGVQVLTPREAKGLEYDITVLVEPAAVRRPSDLYVAMTRSTRALHVVHASQLPAGWPETTA